MELFFYNNHNIILYILKIKNLFLCLNHSLIRKKFKLLIRFIECIFRILHILFLGLIQKNLATRDYQP